MMLTNYLLKNWDRIEVYSDGELLQYRFDNGLVLSCGFGRYHFCGPDTMEVAVLFKGRMQHLLDDTVEGHVPRSAFAWLVRDLDDPNVEGALAQVRRSLERKHELV
jgi:hypothetical protein